MDRRRYLRGLAAGGATSLLAGCVGTLGGLGGTSSAHTYLPKSAMAKKVQSSKLPYPAWGQQLPAVTLPAPLRDTTVTTTQFEGKRNVLLTVFYSHCPKPSPNNSAICRKLITQMRNIQADAETNGYADELAFLAITFDPVRDTAERLRTFADEMHVDLNAGNWYFLRPKDHARAEAVVHGTFGIKFEKQTPTPQPAGNERGASGTPTTPQNYTFLHSEMLFLVNVQGYVERVYRYESKGNPPWQDRRDDVTELIKQEG